MELVDGKNFRLSGGTREVTGFLASVRSVEEAMVAHKNGVDIIDLKEPERGALGAVTPPVMREVVRKIDSERLISATVGDLPCEPRLVAEKVREVAETGIDLIKVGLFEPFHEQLEDMLWAISRESTKGVIIVAFADRYPGDEIIDLVADTGLAGIMLDTAGKSLGSLCEIMTDQQIKRFISRAKEHNLITGLAGSLTKADIPSLLQYKPDYLGFRGALCQGNQRKTDLDERLVQEIRELIQLEVERYGAVA